MKIDKLWSIFGIRDSMRDLTKKLNGKKVTIYGWGLTEEGWMADQLLKQEVKIGWLKNRLLKLSHKEGHGTCRGDSGGIKTHKNIMMLTLNG